MTRNFKQYSYSITEHARLCFDVKVIGSFVWTLGHCSSALELMGHDSYSQKCCLSGAIHVLNCKIRRANNDWSESVVMLLGHRFCEEFVGYETFIAINISGIVRNTCININRL